MRKVSTLLGFSVGVSRQGWRQRGDSSPALAEVPLGAERKVGLTQTSVWEQSGMCLPRFQGSGGHSDTPHKCMEKIYFVFIPPHPQLC